MIFLYKLYIEKKKKKLVTNCQISREKYQSNLKKKFYFMSIEETVVILRMGFIKEALKSWEN